jgi:hypothetical protein
MQLFDAILPIIASASFLLGLGALLILLVQILRIARLGKREKKYRLIGWQSDLRRGLIIVVALMAVSAGNMVFWVNHELRMYLPMHEGMPLGMISTLNPEHPKELPRVIYSTTDESGNQTFEVFGRRTLTFRVFGERISWSKKLAKLGLEDFFKVTRLEFMPDEMLTDPERTPYVSSVRHGSTDLYASISKFDSWLPFVSIDTLASLPISPPTDYSGNLYVDGSVLVLR